MRICTNRSRGFETSGYFERFEKKIESVQLKLQEDKKVTLAHARLLFDALISEFEGNPIFSEGMTKYLAATSKIVHSPSFENAVVKVPNGCCANMTVIEKDTLKNFENSELTLAVSTPINESVSFAAKIPRMEDGKSYDLNSLPAASNICERLFSRSKYTLTPYRSHMTPFNFESSMFLLIDRDFWDIELVSQIIDNNC